MLETTNRFAASAAHGWHSAPAIRNNIARLRKTIVATGVRGDVSADEAAKILIELTDLIDVFRAAVLKLPS